MYMYMLTQFPGSTGLIPVYSYSYPNYIFLNVFLYFPTPHVVVKTTLAMMILTTMIIKIRQPQHQQHAREPVLPESPPLSKVPYSTLPGGSGERALANLVSLSLKVIRGLM